MDWQTLAPKVASHAVAEAGMIFRYGGVYKDQSYIRINM